ncbi:uncharacterized protein N7483_004559 [Penicillium malachiteum]|uniref:uncharacterized protein n=1 Tax=Penicillium malachiteum TaxID=1324776 RepID=UPI00254994EB|nr:uncharacterized protein N7483_004559 [Penicillium malachiteum]KAJ5730051.1 hypothetical protein N7483_004559 [Penicillium malachiteum]
MADSPVFQNVEILYEEYRSERVSFEAHPFEASYDYSEGDAYTDYDSQDDMESLRGDSPAPPPYEPVGLDRPLQSGYVAYVDDSTHNAPQNDATGRPRVKQTAKKSSGRGSITTAQTSRKPVARKPPVKNQTAKKAQPSEKNAESKAQGGRKRAAGTSRQSKREEPKGTSQTASVTVETRINDQQLQYRIEIGSTCTKY